MIYSYNFANIGIKHFLFYLANPPWMGREWKSLIASTPSLSIFIDLKNSL